MVAEPDFSAGLDAVLGRPAGWWQPTDYREIVREHGSMGRLSVVDVPRRPQHGGFFDGVVEAEA